MINLKGCTYQIFKGPLAGQVATILGRDGLFPDENMWLVEAGGHRWSVKGQLLGYMVRTEQLANPPNEAGKER